MNLTVTIHTLPDCVNCDRTEQFLTHSGIPHDSTPLPETDPIRDLITEHGYQSAPIVTVTDDTGKLIDHWAGLRPDRILALKTTIR